MSGVLRNDKMNPALHDLCRLSWISLASSAVCALFSYILIWRKSWWLRLLDVEESFWHRFGLKKGGFVRRFAESRLYAFLFVFFTLTLLFIAVVCAGIYFHFRDKLTH